MEKNVNILIVEDELIFAKDLKNQLETYGFKVPKISSNINEVLSSLRTFKPDIILMDIMLSRKAVDGIEIAENIKKQENIPIIFITAFSDDSTLERAKFIEPYAYILKPIIHFRELFICIEFSIYKHKMEKKFKETANWLFQVLKSASDALVCVDDGLIKFINPSAEKISGWSETDLMGKSIDSLIKTHYSSSDSISGELNKFKKNAKTLTSNYVLKTKSGLEIFIEVVIAPIENEDKVNTGFVLSIKEVTI